ncbi:hypothetical protein V1525DRAFT_173960 [Lipomyces kononenkoae]|uniref:Uncharacterized protein n=1 Tax=Lipomyces kononenkoae TaxID=34357 RepID=A0ACC3T0K7_LIPKO
MARDRSPDYKALWEQAEEARRQAEDARRQAEDARIQEAERRIQAEEAQKQEAAKRRQAEEARQRTTFEEFIKSTHNFVSLPVRVARVSRSTKGTLKKPTGKLCPTLLRPWSDYPDIQQEIYDSVLHFLHPSDKDAPRLFSSVDALEDRGKTLCSEPLSSEKGLEIYEHNSVECNVRDVVAALSKIPKAQEKFKLKDGIKFESHANALSRDDKDEKSTLGSAAVPDRFIYRVDGSTNTEFATIEYKPPHKLSVANLRVGLRPMNFWDEVVQRQEPTIEKEKLKYNAELLTGSALTQEYHVMIREGLNYSYLSTGLALVMLHVRSDDPSTLYYHLCEPKSDVGPTDDQKLRLSSTAVAQALCLCLISLRSGARKQKWRNHTIQNLHTWETDLDYIWSQIPEEERHQSPPSSESQVSLYSPSPSLGAPVGGGHRPTTRSQTRCGPQETMHRPESMDSSDSDSNQATSGRKRTLDQISSSAPLTQPSSQQRDSSSHRRGRRWHYRAEFCTQKCLLGLQRGGLLDSQCPNVELHRQGQDTKRHLISTERLVQLVKQQLDEDLDHNIKPFGVCGSYGAPFKITYVPYGYTVVGKGTTSELWNEVSREADIYRILQKAQGSAVPVFLGAIDLKMIYFLHGGAEIRHMLLMAWGGEDTSGLEHSKELLREIWRSEKEIRALGVVHEDFRFHNALWNEELGRALIIDFHRSKLAPRLLEKRKSLMQPLRNIHV